VKNVCKGYLNYKANYYESFAEFVCVNNDVNINYLNIICCNIKSINGNFDELLLFLENDAKYRDINVILFTETCHNVLLCNYVIDSNSLYFLSVKRIQNDGVMVFPKHYLSEEFFQYDFVNFNIVKLYISNVKLPINLVCVYRSSVTDSDNFINTIRVVLNRCVIN